MLLFFLYILSLHDYEFDTELTFGESNHKLKELIPRIPFYITSTGNEKCKIVRTAFQYQFLKDYLQENIIFRFLSKLDPGYKGVIDIGETFEYIIASLIDFYCLIYQDKNYSEFPGNFFSETILKDMKIKKIKSLELIPKVTIQNKNKNEKNEKEVIQEEKTISTDNFKTLLSNFKENTLGIVAKKSGCEDVYHIPYEDVDIGYQIKSGEQEFSYYDIQEEIDKYGNSKEDKREHILVICSMHIEKKLSSLIGKKKRIYYIQ